MAKIKIYEVNEKIASRIHSAKDLNDFYAYVERLGDEYEFSFPAEYQDEIDELTDDMNYTPGEYDPVNVKRIFAN